MATHQLCSWEVELPKILFKNLKAGQVYDLI